MKRKFTVYASKEAKLKRGRLSEKTNSSRHVRRNRPITAEIVDDFDDWYERCWSVYLDKLREQYPNLEVDQNTHNYEVIQDCTMMDILNLRSMTLMTMMNLKMQSTMETLQTVHLMKKMYTNICMKLGRTTTLNI